jgi:4-amino-4-deoxy-L-arabinose transferase-like glycosyltransferase
MFADPIVGVVDGRWRRWFVPAVVALFVILAAELFLSARLESPTFDEPAHLYAGYMHWVRSDYGVNPEHPPLVKMVASSPLLIERPKYSEPMDIFFRAASVRGGMQLLSPPGAMKLLDHARIAVSFFVFGLGVLLVLASYEMFGAVTAVFALALYVFDPLMIAHGPLLGTDMGAACCVFATVYAFYRYVKRPTWARLAVCAVAAGLALAAKHSAILILPIMLLLGATELVLRRREPADALRRDAIRLGGAVATIAVVAIMILWGIYGFRFAARPDGRKMTPPTEVLLQQLKHPEAKLIGFAERHHLLPEAYLYGLTDVTTLSRDGRIMYLFGKMYPEGRWFYFPAAFVIKSTIGLLLLLAVLPFARDLWRERRGEVLFLAIPAVVFFVMAMTAKLDIGIRHILPVFPFAMVLAAAGAVTLARRSRAWGYAVAVFLVLHVASSAKAFPNYLPYSNEFFGGVSGTYRVLSDSNVGWAGGLKALRAHLEENHIKECWFAYSSLMDPKMFEIPCKRLPTFFSMLIDRGQQEAVPEEIHGPVFISSEEVAGAGWGPGDMSPYYQFSQTRPTRVLAGEILRFDGGYKVSAIASLSHYMLAYGFLRKKDLDQALEHAKASVALAPDLLIAHEALTDVYAARGQNDDAMREYRTAMHLFETVHPEFAKGNRPPQNPLARRR